MTFILILLRQIITNTDLNEHSLFCWYPCSNNYLMSLFKRHISMRSVKLYILLFSWNFVLHLVKDSFICPLFFIRFLGVSHIDLKNILLLDFDLLLFCYQCFRTSVPFVRFMTRHFGAAVRVRSKMRIKTKVRVRRRVRVRVRMMPLRASIGRKCRSTVRFRYIESRNIYILIIIRCIESNHKKHIYHWK
jgi:hypothetical protein